MTLIIVVLVFQTRIAVAGKGVEFAYLLQRFLDLHKVPYGGGSSTWTEVHIGGDAKRNSDLLGAFGREFGVKFTGDNPIFILPPEQQRFTVEAVEKGALQSWKSFSPDSLLVRVFHNLVANGESSRFAEFVRCQYWLQPWLTQQGLRKQTLVGVFSLRDKAKVREVPFKFDL